MKLEWRDYLDDRLIADHSDGFKVIKPKMMESDNNRPLFCPICEAIFLSHYDDEAWDKFKCCDACASRWAYPDLARWNAGWRPSEDDLNKMAEMPI